MSGGIEWGAGIDGPTMKGLKLPGDTPVQYAGSGASSIYGEFGFNQTQPYRLRADHPYYLATSKGFTYWPGGDSAPDDWDGGEVLYRNAQNSAAWRTTTKWEHYSAPFDVIGYKRKAVSVASAEPQALDFTKPIQTRDGRPVRILCTDGRNESHPIVGYIGSSPAISMWGVEGGWMDSDHKHPSDLINAPDVRVEWYGFNENGSGLAYDARDDLPVDAPYHLRITWTDGVPKADIFEAGEPE